MVCFFFFGNSAKDFMGIVPLSAPSEDQRKSTQRVSPLLLFTGIFLFRQIYTVDAYRYGEIFFGCFVLHLVVLPYSGKNHDRTQE